MVYFFAVGFTRHKRKLTHTYRTSALGINTRYEGWAKRHELAGDVADDRYELCRRLRICNGQPVGGTSADTAYRHHNLYD